MSDYVKHFIAGALAASAVSIPVYAESGNLFAGIWAAVMTAAIAGGAKELGDSTGDFNIFDFRDLAFTALGALVPVLFVIGLHFGKG